MVTVISLNGRAVTFSLARAQDAPAQGMRVSVIPATRILTQISADSPHVTDFRASNGFGCFGQYFVCLFYDGRSSDIDQFCQGADLQPIVIFSDVIQTGDGLDINHGLRVGGEEVALQDTEEVCAARDQGCLSVKVPQKREDPIYRNGVIVFKVFQLFILLWLLIRICGFVCHVEE